MINCKHNNKKQTSIVLSMNNICMYSVYIFIYMDHCCVQRVCGSLHLLPWKIIDRKMSYSPSAALLTMRMANSGWFLRCHSWHSAWKASAIRITCRKKKTHLYHSFVIGIFVIGKPVLQAAETVKPVSRKPKDYLCPRCCCSKSSFTFSDSILQHFMCMCWVEL